MQALPLEQVNDKNGNQYLLKLEFLYALFGQFRSKAT